MLSPNTPKTEDFTKTIAAINDIGAVPTILDVICRTTGMGFAAIARVTDEHWIACSVLDNIDFGLKVGGELKLETTICNEIRQLEKAVTIDHVSEDMVYRHHHTPKMYGFQSYISMPIILKSGKFFGTLCAIDPKPARINTPEIIGMFKLFAQLIAFHLDAADNIALSEFRLQEEKETSELREQFIGVLGHDLRNPLGAISMGAELLKGNDLSEDQSMALDLIDRSVARMSDLIEDAVDFTRGRLGGGIALDDMTNAPLEPVLNQAIEAVESQWPDRKIETHFDLNGSIYYDRKRIAQLFTNLLSNAMTHGKRDTPVRVRAIANDEKLELSVANAADLIPPEVLIHLFKPFLRNSSDSNNKGLGLGLYIASQIAKSHGGKLEGSSTEEETRFTFTMEAHAC